MHKVNRFRADSICPYVDESVTGNIKNTCVERVASKGEAV
jgi:hypothetical protein